MKKIVVDASLVVKWFISEKYSQLALEIRDHFVNGEIELFAPNLLQYEVLNALKYSNLFSRENLAEAVTSLENYGIIQLPLNGEYAQKTMTVAVEHNISIYDAAYVGLTDVMGICAYSADKKLVDTVQKEYGKSFLFITTIEERFL
ncbi:MAG: type II toxin-antitoxin system VapC family toxin [Candidatus Heimdallarchaeota archaeon]|nr:MAG: type II toxin-antitoxin system VapC family toxin [Candidatus Heimdallarchaeota archaeon]